MHKLIPQISLDSEFEVPESSDTEKIKQNICEKVKFSLTDLKTMSQDQLKMVIFKRVIEGDSDKSFDSDDDTY